MPVDQNKKSVVITFELLPSDYKKTMTKLGNDGLVDAVESLVSNYVNGGIVLSPSEVARIGRVLRKTVESSDEIVKKVEESTGVKDGMNVLKVPMDPAIVDSYADIAACFGSKPEDFIVETVMQVLGAGWVHGLNRSEYTLVVSDNDKKYLEELLGKRGVTGTDLVNLVKGRVAEK
jgi:hypothetical protein